MSVQEIEQSFPNIIQEGYEVTSKETFNYNCFAWAMKNKSQWWSPTKRRGYYWRSGVPTTLAVESFTELYNQEGGYVPCEGDGLEEGFEKIALYADENGDVTHAAKQTPEGLWSSKLGDWEDIQHNSLRALEGNFYGKAVRILKRPTAS